MQSTRKSRFGTLITHLPLLFLLIFFLIPRIIPILPDNFAFQYDHAKDSLVMFNLFHHHNITLVGPTTSIPGVFYGPAWNYIALPLNILLNFHPIASVITVLLIGTITLVILYRWVHPLAAILYSSSIGVIGTQQSAWTPYMTVLCMVPLVVGLIKILETKRPALPWYLVVGLSLGLLFHVEVAFAVVITVIVCGLVLHVRTQLSPRYLLAAVGICLMTLIPSGVFELTHDFQQTRSVIEFVRDYRTNAHIVQPNRPGIWRIVEIAEYQLGTAANAVSPITVPAWAGVVILLLCIMQRHAFTQSERTVLGSFIVGTTLLYLVLPAKSYYFVGMLPVWIIACTIALKQVKLPTHQQHHSLAALVLITGMATASSYQTYQHLRSSESFPYGPKAAAVEAAYALSEGAPFASYHFVPEVYDYTYQLLYLRSGKTLPVEFSYAPQESSYFPDKIVPLSTTPPKYIMLIVENPVYQNVLDEWNDRVTKNLNILDTVVINDAILVHKAERLP